MWVFQKIKSTLPSFLKPKQPRRPFSLVVAWSWTTSSSLLASSSMEQSVCCVRRFKGASCDTHFKSARLVVQLYYWLDGFWRTPSLLYALSSACLPISHPIAPGEHFTILIIQFLLFNMLQACLPSIRSNLKFIHIFWTSFTMLSSCLHVILAAFRHSLGEFLSGLFDIRFSAASPTFSLLFSLTVSQLSLEFLPLGAIQWIASFKVLSEEYSLKGLY